MSWNLIAMVPLGLAAGYWLRTLWDNNSKVLAAVLFVLWVIVGGFIGGL